MAIQQGWNEQTPAVRSILGAAMRVGRKVKRAASSVKRAVSKRRKKRAGARGAKRSASSSRSGKRLVKGSAAAKAYMARIRKMRKK